MNDVSELTEEDHAALRKLGKAPRRILVVLTILGTIVGAAIWYGNSDPIGPAIFIGMPLGGLIASLRIRMTVEDDAVILRSYLRTYVLPFEDLLGFSNVPYAGFWNRFGGGEGWGNFGARMIDASGSLQATLCSRRTCEHLVQMLTARVPQDFPPGYTG